MKDKIKKAIFIVITSPVLIWFILHPADYLKEWKNTPRYFKNNVHSIFSADKVAKVDEERWNAFGSAREELSSKLYYNKGMIILNEFFTIISNLSPRIYFQSGDGTGLSPSHVEPIGIPLFFFWFIGVVHSLNRKNYKIIFFPLVFAVTAYLFGQRNMAYLLPISVIYSFLAVTGISSIKNIKVKNTAYVLMFLYGIYLIGRMFLIK